MREDMGSTSAARQRIAADCGVNLFALGAPPMRSASYQHRAYLGRSSPRRRAASLLLALALVALVIALLIQLGILPAHLPESEPSLSTFDLSAGQQQAARTQTKKASAKAAHAHAAPPPRPSPVTPPPPLPVTKSTPSPKLLTLSRDEFAATDIGKIKGHADAADDGDDGKDSTAPYGPGEGPGGARLYNAQWYREPTPAQLSFYLKPGTPTGTAYIECKTIENYHVENCRELGETPPGSGLARAVRQAAWQFLVRPPRRGGKPLVGAWVRIRYDFTLIGGD